MPPSRHTLLSWFSVKWKIWASPLAKLVEAMMDLAKDCRLIFSVLASEFKFAITLGEDLGVTAGEPSAAVT